MAHLLASVCGLHLSPFGGFLSSFVRDLVSQNSHMDRYLSEDHWPSQVLESLSLLRDLFQDVNVRSSLCFGCGPDGNLVICVDGKCFFIRLLDLRNLVLSARQDVSEHY